MAEFTQKELDEIALLEKGWPMVGEKALEEKVLTQGGFTTADLPQPMLNNMNGLFNAILQNDKKAAKQVLDKGVNLNGGDDDGVTLLGHAVRYNREEIVSLILKDKSRLKEPYPFTKRNLFAAFTIAKKVGSKKIIELIKKAGAS